MAKEKTALEMVLSEISKLREELDGKFSKDLSRLRTRAAIAKAISALEVARATRAARIKAENDEAIQRERDLLARPKSELLILERGKALRSNKTKTEGKAKAKAKPKAKAKAKSKTTSLTSAPTPPTEAKAA